MTAKIVMRQTGGRAVLIAAATVHFVIFLACPARAQAPNRTPARSITLGIVAETQQSEVEQHFREFIRYVAAKLSAASPFDGRIAMAPTQSRLASLLTERKADFYMESPYPTYLINSVYGAGKLLLRRWKGGMADYHALIFTPKDGATKRLEDLRGKLVAFEDPGSTSGHFLPKNFLTRRGFKLIQKNQVDASVGANEIGYIFAYSQDKLIDWVMAKQVAAGAFSNDDYANLDERKKAEIAILAQTDDLPRHLVSIRKDLAPAMAKALEKLLLSMHQDGEGRSILQRLDGTTKFEALPGGELAMRQRLLDTFLSAGKK